MTPENETSEMKPLPIIQDPSASSPPGPDPQMPAQPRTQKAHLSASPTLIIGITFTLLGIVIFLSEAGVPYAGEFINLWPMAFIALGYLKLKRSQDKGGMGGWALIALGTLLLIDKIPGVDLEDLIGPMIITGIGVAIILHAIRRQRKSRPEFQRPENCISGQALFSALKHRHPKSPFQGGDITAIFGSAELDLRDALLEGESVVLENFVMFGGAEIRVPENWDVRVQATAIFGGIDNKSTPASSEAQNRPVLILSGLVLFGGVEVRS